MKTLIQVLKKAFMAIAIILFTTAAFAQKKEAKKVETVVFNVEMDCQECVNKIEKNIPFEKGVKDLKVDLKSKKVTVSYKTNATTKENLKKALEKLDFKVTKEKK
ncbi:heavy metal-associated domain-containing protein [Labilibaculum manganireducens]|uniref:heavy-metal-associated domain-containing protein n=1 Tax=Labilibaculum manganireducens TaxID=1940525 RepID=UPI0029F57EC3|nr:heavy metal-associated domain-containing protein [Labilibaculum manganireducens]